MTTTKVAFVSIVSVVGASWLAQKMRWRVPGL